VRTPVPSLMWDPFDELAGPVPPSIHEAEVTKWCALAPGRRHVIQRSMAAMIEMWTYRMNAGRVNHAQLGYRIVGESTMTSSR
jgi:hypothetical protein